MKKLIVLFLSVLQIVSIYSRVIRIKFATVAPDGSVWMNKMRELDKELRKQTAGKVKFKFYPGGILGDDRDIIRKMKSPVPMVSCSSFSGSGLNSILKESRVFDVPFTFNNYKEIDYLRDVTFDTYSQLFKQKGFILLGWVDIGNVYIFSKNKITNIEDLRKQKVWVWDNDQIAVETFLKFGVKPISLNLAEVLTSLQTGLINTIYGSPMGVLSLQWHRRLNYYIKEPMTFSSSALLISKKIFFKLSVSQQKVLISLSKKYIDEMNSIIRNDEKKALENIERNNIVGLSIFSVKTEKEITATRALIIKELNKTFFTPGYIYSIQRIINEYRIKVSKE